MSDFSPGSASVCLCWCLYISGAHLPLRPACFSSRATSWCLGSNFQPRRWLLQIYLLLYRFPSIVDLIASTWLLSLVCDRPRATAWGFPFLPPGWPTTSVLTNVQINFTLGDVTLHMKIYAFQALGRLLGCQNCRWIGFIRHGYRDMYAMKLLLTVWLDFLCVTLLSFSTQCVARCPRANQEATKFSCVLLWKWNIIYVSAPWLGSTPNFNGCSLGLWYPLQSGFINIRNIFLSPHTPKHTIWSLSASHYHKRHN